MTYPERCSVCGRVIGDPDRTGTVWYGHICDACFDSLPQQWQDSLAATGEFPDGVTWDQVVEHVRSVGGGFTAPPDRVYLVYDPEWALELHGVCPCDECQFRLAGAVLGCATQVGDELGIVIDLDARPSYGPPEDGTWQQWLWREVERRIDFSTLGPCPNGRECPWC